MKFRLTLHHFEAGYKTFKLLDNDIEDILDWLASND